MATIASRISANGTLLLNGNFDEVTFNNTTPVIKNLITYSQQIGGINWIGVPGQATLSSSTQAAPDGSNTASLIATIPNTATYLYQENIAVVPNTTYTFSFYAKLGTAINSQYLFAVYNASALSFIAVDQAVSLTNLAYTRVTYTFTTPAGCTLIRCYPFRNGSTSIASAVTFYVWGAQLELGSTATVYQGIGATNTLVTPTFKTKTAVDSIYSTGVYDEVTYSSTAPVIKNLSVVTEDFTQWSKNASPNDYTVVANSTTAPNNTLTADLIVKGTTAGTSSICYKLFSGAINTTYCGSIYVKAGGYSKVQIVFGSSSFNNVNNGGTINLLTGTVNSLLNGSTVTVTNAGNGWYRVSVTATSSGTVGNYVFSLTPLDDSYLANFAGNGTSGIYAWGAQVELGSTATIYQGIGATNTLVPPNFAKREDAGGNLYVTGAFDEFTGAPVVDSSLVLWVDAGQSASYSGTGVTVGNLINPSINGTLTNGPTYNTSGSFSFNGTNQYITFGDNLDLIGSDISGSIWVNLNSFDATFSPLIDKLTTAGNYRFIVNPSGTVGFGIRGADNTYVAQSTPSGISLSLWYNLAFTFQGTAVNIYINGILATSGALTTTTRANTTSDLKIGYSSNNNRYLNGSVSQAQIYNRALTADEVQQNFNALRRRYGI